MFTIDGIGIISYGLFLLFLATIIYNVITKKILVSSNLIVKILVFFASEYFILWLESAIGLTFRTGRVIGWIFFVVYIIPIFIHFAFSNK